MTPTQREVVEVIKKAVKEKLEEFRRGLQLIPNPLERKLRKFTTLVNGEGKSHTKPRLVPMLQWLWNKHPGLFLLCALVSTPTSLGKVTEGGFGELEVWWKEQTIPTGLERALQDLKSLNYLPNRRGRLS